jgi:hypothetical protein
MSAMATILTASNSEAPAGTLSRSRFLRDQQLDRDPEQQQPAGKLRHGTSAGIAPHGKMMLQRPRRPREKDSIILWRFGGARQASAMTRRCRRIERY